MAYLRHWQDIVDKMLEKVRKHDNLLRLVANSTPEPYEAPVPKWEDVLMKNVFPCPKEPNSVDTQKSFINIYMGQTDIVPENPYYHEDLLYIEVDCHLETWLLKNGEIRPYSMCSILDQMVDNLYVPDMSIQKVIPSKFRVVKFSDMFYGYRLVYKLTNIGSMKCD